MRNALKTLSLLLASLICVLAVAELGLRLAGVRPIRHRGPGRVRDAADRIALACFDSNPRGYFDVDLRQAGVRKHYEALGIESIDGIAQRKPFAVEYRYNSLRFRDREFGPKPPGVTRVLVLGDSFTEGQGIKQDDIYPRLVERHLNASGPGRFEVLNCGHRGFDFPGLADVFEGLLRFDPDVFVYAMVLNDPVRSKSFDQSLPYVNDWIMDRRRRLGGDPPDPLGLRLLGLAADAVESYRIGRDTTRWYQGLYSAPNREGWLETARLLEGMRRKMDERGGRFVVVLWPLLVGLEGRYPFVEATRTIAQTCRELRIPQYDLMPALGGHRTADLWVHPGDHHPNEIAQRLVAPVIARAVLDNMPPKSVPAAARPLFGSEQR
jgi:hypothetical protein